eukprot:2896490-Rhodomonas_salina.2
MSSQLRDKLLHHFVFFTMLGRAGWAIVVHNESHLFSHWIICEVPLSQDGTSTGSSPHRKQ